MAVNYTTLIGGRELEYSIKNLCNDSRVPATGILQEAQQWIYQRLRVRQMITRKTNTPLASGADTIALPADWQYPCFLIFTPNALVVKSSPKFKTLDFVIGQWGYSSGSTRQTGRPSYWATDADNIQFDTVADQAYPTLIVYYAHKTLLGPTNLTNFLTERYLSLLRAVCLRFAFEHLQNQKMMTYWTAQAEAAVRQANVDSDMQLEGMELEVAIGGDESGLYGYGTL